MLKTNLGNSKPGVGWGLKLAELAFIWLNKERLMLAIMKQKLSTDFRQNSFQ